ARAIDDVPERAAAAILVGHEWNAVDGVDHLPLDERRSVEQRNDGAGFGDVAQQRIAITAGQAAKSDERTEVTVIDPPGAPKVAESIAFEFLEQDVGPELLVGTALGWHGMAPEIRLCGSRIPPHPM